MTTLTIRIPLGQTSPFRFRRARVQRVTIPGFERFAFCLHRQVDTDRSIPLHRRPWIVAAYPLGLRVTGLCRTRKDALREARQRLQQAGVPRTAEAFKQGAQRLGLTSSPAFRPEIPKRKHVHV